MKLVAMSLLLLSLAGCFGTTKVFVFPDPPETLMKHPSDLSVIVR